MDPEARPLPSSIPSAHRTLVACVRDALRNCPPPAGAAEPAWSQLDRAAREQGVDPFLFPWLAAHYPARFGASAARPDSVPGAWRARVLSDLPRVALRQRQLADLAAGFARAGLDLIMLKGAWLAETAYADPALRSMSDIDVLVRSDQRDLGHAAMLELGYAASADTLHSRFAYDQLYRHPLHPYSVEMHWAVSSEQEADSPEADMAAVWQHAVSARLFGHPLRALSVSDQLAHLAHHMLHHQFAVPLRAYLDVALLVRAQGDTLSPEPSKPPARAGKPARPFRSSCVSRLSCLTSRCPAPWRTTRRRSKPRGATPRFTPSRICQPRRNAAGSRRGSAIARPALPDARAWC